MDIFSYRKIRSRVAESVRRLISPRSETASPLGSTPRPATSRSLFFWPNSKRSNGRDSASSSSRTLNIATPDSSRSVSFEDAITWPYIDDEI
uniref:Uncharacterized protein n=1 Tax=Panagrolaimus superbus TaxID=310955 RepID=A0A914Y975_9BILA